MSANFIDPDELLPKVKAAHGLNVRSKEHDEEARQPEPFPIERLDEFVIAARHSIVQGIGLDDGAVAAIVGSPNAGKTAFAISLATAVASRAESWLGLKLSGGAVCYFAPEAPTSVKMRAKAAQAWLREHSPGPTMFYISDAVPAIGGQSTADQDAERIIATVRKVASLEGEAVVLVFIDTLASCLGDGDENGDGMLRLVASAKKVAATTQACVVLVHHPSKADSTSLRGHGSLAAACDSIIRVDVEGRTDIRVATLAKARDHATGVQLRFELEVVTLDDRDSFGDPLTTVVVRTTSSPPPRPRPSGRQQQKLLDELERRYRTGERSWDEAKIRKAGRDLDMPRNSPADALKGLIKAGYLAGTPGNLSLKYPPEVPT